MNLNLIYDIFKFMGIAYFFSHIYKKYNGDNDLLIEESQLSTFDVECLFLDYNSMIHPCSHQLLATLDNTKEYSVYELDDLIIDNVLDYTRYVMNMIKSKSVYIMVDGVAPRAKIHQQRSRRYKSRMFKRDDNEIKWDSNKITPGTCFMKKLKYKLEIFIEKLKNEGCDFNINIDFDHGEGEHKMMTIINGLNNLKEDKKICIYGLDADLIMLSLMSVYSNKIILVRDNKVEVGKRVFTYVNIKSLEESIIKEIRGRYNYDNKCVDELLMGDRNIIYDYILLCMLLGNDFLEHIPSLIIKEGGLNMLIKIYIQALKSGNKGTYKDGDKGGDKGKCGLVLLDELDRGNIRGAINLEMLCYILYNIGKSEDYFYKNVYSVYKKEVNVYRDTSLEEYKNIYFYKDDCIKYNEVNYKNRYYIFYGIGDVKDACKRYLEGLYWVLGYYNGHMHDNWLWYYKYNNVPFASDIGEYLGKEINFRKYIMESKNLEKSDRINSMQQLFMVLPKESLMEIIGEEKSNSSNKLLKKLERLINMGEVMEKYFPKNVCVDIINKEYLWQSKIFLDDFNMSILEMIL